jgi:AcrR family transcriptional regulator
MSSLREDNRRQLRELLVSAARELTIAGGWAGVRMADVADSAGVSRQTVYNEFGDKKGLAEALARREVTRFAEGVRRNLFAHGPDVRAAGRATVLHVLTSAARDPLIKAVLTSARGGSDELLPYLTTRAGLALEAAGVVLREWAAAHLPHLDARTVATGADAIARLTVSHVVLPSAPPDDTAATLAEVFVRLFPDS